MAEVKVGKKTFEVKPIGLRDRCEINDLLIKNMESTSFSVWVDVIEKTTNLKEAEINDLSTDEIIQLAEKCINSINKKK
jgi:hypothetical protein